MSNEEIFAKPEEHVRDIKEEHARGEEGARRFRSLFDDMPGGGISNPFQLRAESRGKMLKAKSRIDVADSEMRSEFLTEGHEDPLWARPINLQKGGAVEINGILYEDWENYYTVNHNDREYVVMPWNGKLEIYEGYAGRFLDEDDPVYEEIMDMKREDDEIRKTREAYIFSEAQGDPAKEWMLRKLLEADPRSLFNEMQKEGIVFYPWDDSASHQEYLGYRDGKLYSISYDYDVDILIEEVEEGRISEADLSERVRALIENNGWSEVKEVTDWQDETKWGFE